MKNIKVQFHGAQSWKEKIFDADKLWNQVGAILKQASVEMPKTSRRPDVRMIVNNNSGQTILFRNPGNHSDKAETIPGTGDKTSAMVMVKGETLNDQMKNAQTINDKYDLGNKGLSQEFINDISAGKLDDFVDEAYGPAPYEGQTSKLIDLEWNNNDGSVTNIEAKNGGDCAFGARKAEEETVFLAKFPIYVKGTGTTPEKVESEGMCVAVSIHWETQEVSTRPIVPSVAREFYGDSYNNIPEVNVDDNGNVENIDLRNGTNIVPEYSNGIRPALINGKLAC